MTTGPHSSDDTRPRLLYIAPESQLQPYYADLQAAVGDRLVLALYDFAAAPQPQFDGIDVVVEHGGGYASREMVDAGARAGVRLWQVTATGTDHIDLEHFRGAGIPVAHMPGPRSTAIPMAEHVLLLMLAHAKRLLPSQESLHAGIVNAPMTAELCGKTVAIVGLGASGRELATRCKAMGMVVMAVDQVDVPSAERDRLGLSFFGGPEQLDRLLAEADYVSLHLPLTPGTRGILGRRELGLMKRTAVLVNVARGALVDEEALVDALERGGIGGAGLDVFVEEPVDPAHPLLRLPNVIATPHNGVVSRELSLRRAALAVENVERVTSGLPPLFALEGGPEA